jgi:hypothetical protein
VLALPSTLALASSAFAMPENKKIYMTRIIEVFFIIIECPFVNILCTLTTN